MQKFLSKYSLAAHLAILAAAPLFLVPYCGDDIVGRALLWLSFICAVWYFLEPSRMSYEMLHDARIRVARALVKDPLFWIFAALAVIAAVRMANGNIGMVYDASISKWTMKEPELPFFPSCVSGTAFLPFATVVALLVIVESCRNAMGKGARMFFLSFVSIIAGIAGLAAAVICRFGGDMLLPLTECPISSSSYFGTAFGVYALAGAAAIAGSFEMGWGKWMLVHSLGAAGCLVGLYLFAPAYVIVAFLAAFVLIIVFSVSHAGIVGDRTMAFKTLAAIVMVVFMVAISVMWLTPKSVESARLEPFANGEFALLSDRFWKVRELCVSFAAKVWNSSPWTGSGIGAFPIAIKFHAAPGDWVLLPPGQTCAVSGWWTLLAERGLVGVVSFALVALLMLTTFIIRAVRSIGSVPNMFYPAAFLAIVAVSLLAAQAYFDVSLFRTDVLLAVASLFAIGAGTFVPPPKQLGGEKASKQETDGQNG